MRLSIMTLCFFFLPSYTQKTPSRRYSRILQSSTTLPTNKGHFLAKLIYGLNLCLQAKSNLETGSWAPLLSSSHVKPLFYYPVIMNRVLNRKPIILPQTFQQMGKVLSYLNKFKEYIKRKLDLGIPLLQLRRSKVIEVTSEQELLKHLYKIKRRQTLCKIVAWATILLPVCVTNMLHKRQENREKARGNGTDGFIDLAKKAFYQKTHHHHHHHHRHRHSRRYRSWELKHN